MRDRVAGGDRDAPAGRLLEQASAARRNLPARAARPEHLAELRVPVPDREGVLAEITSLAGDARHQHLRHRDRPLGRRARAACSSWWSTPADAGRLRDGHRGARATAADGPRTLS